MTAIIRVIYTRCHLVLMFLCAWLAVFMLPNTFLHVTVVTPAPTLVQVYFPAQDGSLSEDRSSYKKISSGATDLSFSLNPKSRWVRFDPVAATGHARITDLYVQTLLFRIRIEFERIEQASNIGNLASTAGGASFTALTDDPSVVLRLPSNKVMYATAGSASILAALFVFLFWRLKPCFNVLVISVTAAMQRLRPALSPWHMLGFVGVLVGIWLYPMTNYLVSIDQESAAFRTNQEPWVAQGRWVSYLLTKYVLPQPVVPFLPIALLCTGLLFAYMLILSAHRLRLTWQTTALFPLFAGFPVWYLISEFYANLLSITVGIVLACLSVLVLTKDYFQENATNNKTKRSDRLLVVCLLLACATGAYQALYLTFIAMVAGCMLWQASRHNVSLINLLNKLPELCVVTIGGLAFYFIIDQVFKNALGASSSYIQQMSRPDTLIAQPFHALGSSLNEAWLLYSGSVNVYGVSLWASGVLMLAGVGSVFLKVANTPNLLVVVVVTALTCLIAPFGISILAGGAGMVPYRAMLGVSYVVWLFALIALQAHGRFASLLATAFLAIAIFQMLNAHASYNALRTLTLEHDKALAAQVYAHIVKVVPEFDRFGETYVDIYGAKSLSAPFPRVSTSTIGGSFFEWDGGNPERILTFMRLLGYDGILPAPVTERQRLVSVYEQMPVWPAENSVRFYEGVVLVKMGPRPGATHQSSLVPQ